MVNKLEIISVCEDATKGQGVRVGELLSGGAKFGLLLKGPGH